MFLILVFKSGSFENSLLQRYVEANGSKIQMTAWWHLDITGYLDSVLKPIFFVVYCFSRQPFGVVTHGLRIRVPDCNNYFQITCTPTNLENETGNGCDTTLNNIMHLPSFGSVLGQSAFHSVKYRVNLEHFPGIVWKWRGEKTLIMYSYMIYSLILYMANDCNKIDHINADSATHAMRQIHTHNY